jgi:hypothetical protein
MDYYVSKLVYKRQRLLYKQYKDKGFVNTKHN